MPNFPYQRDLTSELQQVEYLSGQVVCTIGSDRWQLEAVDDEYIEVVSNDMGPFIRFSNGRVGTLDNEKMSITVNSRTTDFLVKKSFISSISLTSFSPKTVARVFEFGISGTSELKAKMLAIIPIQKDAQKPDFMHYFCVEEHDRLCGSVNSLHFTCCYNGMRFNLKGHTFIVYEYVEELNSPRRQLVVETENLIDHVEFVTCIQRILVAIGFFTGSYYFGPFWVFNSESHEFVTYLHNMPKGGCAKYHMFSLNPYEYFAAADKSPETVKQIEASLKPITRGQFEKLLDLLDQSEFSHMFYTFHDLVLNSNSLSVATRLTLYAGCVEMCAKCVPKITGMKEQRSQLFDAETREKLYTAFTEVIDKTCPTHPDSEKCKKKLHNVFQAANQDVLTTAFETVGVVLNDDDKKETLRLRNPLLHGNNAIKSTFDAANSWEYINECERKCFGFHALIWRFIMKLIGYDGIYIDVATINELFRSSKSNNSQPLSKKV